MQGADVPAIALAALALCITGCAARSDQPTATPSQFREALILSLVLPSKVMVGEETPLRFRVENSGRRTIEACVGLSRNVRIVPEDDTEGNEPFDVLSHIEDRPICQRHFRVAPGAHFEWNEAASVPGVLLGHVSLEVDVQIVDPRHCHPSTGCPGTMLTASAPIDIREK